MLNPKSSRYLGFTLLALTMAVTRFGSHGGTPWAPPDASWAVFFLAGFTLAGEWRWALAALLFEAVAIDFAAIRHGVGNYCLTPAYWFIVPAYATLWLGGAWLRQRYQRVPRDLGRLAISLAASVTVCFLLTQGSFYWLGGRIAAPSLAGWWSNFLGWYGMFMAVSAGYVGFAALGYLMLTRRTAAPARLRTR